MLASRIARFPLVRRALVRSTGVAASVALLYGATLPGGVVAAAQATATCRVTSSDGKSPEPGSLRAMLADPACDSIDFDPGVFHIVLAVDLLVSRSVKIIGPGAHLLTLDGNHQKTRVITIGTGAETIQKKESQEGGTTGIAVEISGLTITGGHSDLGGGIFNEGGTLTLRQVIVAGNQAIKEGGGIWNNGTMHLIDVWVADNTTPGTGGGVVSRPGGDKALGGGVTTMKNVTIRDNTTGGVGGGFYSSQPSTIEHSTISGNSAGKFGGVLAEAPLTMINSTIANNTARADVGGLGLIGVKHIIMHATVANNTADFNSSSGGVLALGSLGSPLMKNVVVSGNSPNNCSGGVTTQGVNFSDDKSCGGFTQVNDMGLGPLADNGGPTWTMALMDGSPAIDVAADCTDDEFNPILTDQRGVTRPVGAACDAGAYEKLPTVVVDTEAPVFGELPDLTFQATSSLGAIVSYGVAVSDNEDPSPSVVCEPHSNTTFEIGATTVECTATDASGNAASASFTVTVVDTTAPTIVYSGNAGTYEVSDTVNITCVATDAVGVTSSSCVDIVGPATSFQVGENTVTSTATDAAGNTATASVTFTVVVTSTGLQALIAEIAGSSAGQLIEAVQNIASAPNANARAGRVTAFKNQVHAQLKSGKITAAQASLLITLVDAMN